MHELAFPMRWADLDMLEHVNNVVYLDYAAESRAVLADEGLLDGLGPVAGLTVTFERPLRLGRSPVVVASTIAGSTIRQQICQDSGDGRTVFAEVVTRLGPRHRAAPRAGITPLPMRVRRSDLDDAGAVTPTKMFELFQEARILMISSHLGTMTPGSYVVGTSDVTLHAPVPWRLDPYEIAIWISRVGRGSFTIGAELCDGPTVLASSTTVLVGFDPVTQRSRPFEDPERRQLAGLIPD